MFSNQALEAMTQTDNAVEDKKKAEKKHCTCGKKWLPSVLFYFVEATEKTEIYPIFCKTDKRIESFYYQAYTIEAKTNSENQSFA